MQYLSIHRIYVSNLGLVDTEYEVHDVERSTTQNEEEASRIDQCSSLSPDSEAQTIKKGGWNCLVRLNKKILRNLYSRLLKIKENNPRNYNDIYPTALLTTDAAVIRREMTFAPYNSHSQTGEQGSRLIESPSNLLSGNGSLRDSIKQTISKILLSVKRQTNGRKKGSIYLQLVKQTASSSSADRDNTKIADETDVGNFDRTLLNAAVVQGQIQRINVQRFCRKGQTQPTINLTTDQQFEMGDVKEAKNKSHIDS
ncbi:MAG: hypothetical protein EZS28_015492 [Streblomastix strix]|uniref:Uncharacterized protein n=1 Tax=Streblomastix strix TaxID=222440 RepID=A0A5J4W2R8_9EUKA|nr:MAG: hypothetical protein EZS28_015492 [Streblomastix strix]